MSFFKVVLVLMLTFSLVPMSFATDLDDGDTEVSDMDGSDMDGGAIDDSEPVKEVKKPVAKVKKPKPVRKAQRHKKVSKAKHKQRMKKKNKVKVEEM